MDRTKPKQAEQDGGDSCIGNGDAPREKTIDRQLPVNDKARSINSVPSQFVLIDFN
jgi:hypothetical protein